MRNSVVVAILSIARARLGREAIVKVVTVFLVVATMGGCGIARRAEIAKQAEELKQRSAAAAQDCVTRFPAGNSATAVSRMQCLNDALLIVRPIMPYPDLLDSFIASRLVIAEHVQKGQITLAEANEQIASKRSAFVAEEQRRLLANRSVSAQETMAQNIGGPTTCTRTGNTVSCF
jgi:hypothetical protein